MKKFTLVLGGILTLLGTGTTYNNYDVEIIAGEKVIVFETKQECKTAKEELISLFDQKKLDPDQGFIVKAFKTQSCGLLEDDIPQSADEMTVTENKVYYTKQKYLDKKNELYDKVLYYPEELALFEQMELVGIVNEELN